MGGVVRRLIYVISLLVVAGGAQAQKMGEEPGWSMTTISIANACGADTAKVDLAAGYVAEWGKRNLQDPSRLTKETVLEFINHNEDIKSTIKEKGAFIYPCSRWRAMLDLFLQSKGSVMGGLAPEGSKTEAAGTKGQTDVWSNRAGKCSFSIEPSKSSIERVNLTFGTDREPSLEISLYVKSQGLAVLGPGQKNQCRFYSEIKGSMTLGGEKLVATRSAFTACNIEGDKVGSEHQFLDMNAKGE